MTGRLLRSVALLIAVTTASMPGLLAVAEGVVEAAATAATAHVEAAGGSESCPVAHDAHCAACSMLRHAHTGPADAIDSRVFARSTGTPPRTPGHAAASRLLSSGTPRAPPAAA